MNICILSGRLTRDPEYKIIAAKTGDLPHATYTLAVNRIGEGADFISCAAFGKNADFAKNYLSKGTKILIMGHIQTGSYTNKEGVKVYTEDVIVDRHEFCESKSSASKREEPEGTGFMDVPDDLEGGLPFR